VRHEGFLERRDFLHNGKPDIARPAHRCNIIGKQPIGHIGNRQHHRVVKPAPLFIFSQNIQTTDITTDTAGFDENFGKRGNIAYAHIQPLPGNRMHAMGRIPDQGNARVGVAICVLQTKRVRNADR